MKVQGQEKPLKFLERIYESGKIPNSLLIHGVEGSGKLETAVEFAKGLLCENGSVWGCGTCKSCRLIEGFKEELKSSPDNLRVTEDIGGKSVFVYLKGSHPDFALLPPDGTQIRIDQIRGLKSFLSTKPLLGKRKVVIIESAQLMNLQASNSLLKVLEEPPVYSHIIMTATSPESLMPTVSSRLFPVRFTPLRKEVIGKELSLKDGFLLELSKGSLKRAKLFKEKELLVKKFKGFPPKSAEELFKLSSYFDKLSIDDKVAVLEVMEESVYNLMKVNRINKDKASEILERLRELRVALQQGVKGSLALVSLAKLWR